MGYPFGKKGWKLFDLDTREFFVSRDVKFFEDIFPYVDMQDIANNEDATTAERSPSYHDILIDDEQPAHVQQGYEQQTPNSSAYPDLTPEPQPDSTPQMGRGQREKFTSVLLKDFVTHTTAVQSPSLATPLPQSSGKPYPIIHYINCGNFSPRYQNFIAAVTAGTEPRSFKEAIKHEGWKASMHNEIRALEDNGTWTLEPLPVGKKLLGSQWVYKIKYLSNGEVERLKSRLVVYGNHQEAGVDYTETFAPVAKMTTVRVFLAVAASKNWELHQMDVHNAFLHGDLREEVYMKPPPGFKPSNPNLVCRLRKSLYGLKQAPRCWFAKLATALKNYGFRQSYSDYSLFTYVHGEIRIHMLVYVDDLIISGNQLEAIRRFKQYLCGCSKMKDLGPLKYFLGIEVARNPSGLFLCQRKNTLDIVTETGLLGSKPSAFPIQQNHQLELATGAHLFDPEPYRRLVGRLIYLAVTRPDPAYSVHILSQFMQCPRVEHWEATLREVRYLKGTPGQGILLKSATNLLLTGWCDSDWAACPITRRSLSGWIVYLGGSPISWKKKKQPTVSRSSAEAEYRSMAAITSEVKWLKGLLTSFGIPHPKHVTLYCDSESAIYLAKNPVFHERMKHIEVDCHFVRDAIVDGLIAPAYVHTKLQLADILTKALGKATFDNLVLKLGIYDPHAPT